MNQEQENPLALCGVKTDPQSATYALQKMEQAHIPVVAPGGTTNVPFIPEGYAISVSAIVVDKDDTYKMDGALCLKADALRKLARGLGVSWDPSTFRRLDDQRDPHYCSMVVGGSYRDYTGEMVQITGTRAVDLRDGAPEMESMRSKPKQLHRARMNIAQICETKAKNRAIADACVSRTITQQDVGREIVMAKVYRAAPIDPAGATQALYGPQNDEPRQVEAEVASAPAAEITPPHARGTGSSAGLRIPDQAVFGADRGKPITEASPAGVLLFHDKVVAMLDTGKTSDGREIPPQVLEKFGAELPALQAELSRRKPEVAASPSPEEFKFDDVNFGAGAEGGAS